MTPELLVQLGALCRDEVAFDRLKQILAEEIHPLERQIIHANFQLERQKALFGVISRLRNPLDLETIFQTTATEVRQLMGADRVGMFRFYPDAHWNDGEFVSEDVDPEFDSAIATKIHDHCFGDQFAVHYQYGSVKQIFFVILVRVGGLCITSGD